MNNNGIGNNKKLTLNLRPRKNLAKPSRYGDFLLCIEEQPKILARKEL